MTGVSAGYSKTPLPVKLGLKPGARIRLVNPPGDFWTTLGLAPSAFDLCGDGTGQATWQQLFVRTQDELIEHLPNLRAAMSGGAVLWVAWPKGGRSDRGQLTREAVREIVLQTDLVDIKVCAFDATWSALKFVIRTSRRG